MSIYDEFEKELVKISLNIDTLTSWIIVLTHQDKVLVEFHSAILADNHTRLIFLRILTIYEADRSIFYRFWFFLHIRLASINAHWYNFESIFVFLVFYSNKSDLVSLEILKDYWTHCTGNLLHTNYLEAFKV